MKKKLFITWHYSKGMESFLEIWKDYLVFFWNYFSVFDLFQTLFYPWKKDIYFRDWRGLHPLRWLQQKLTNLLARFLGSVVRSAVIVSGILIELLVFLSGIILFFFYIFAPLAAILSGIMLFVKFSFLSGAIFFVSAILLGISFSAYRHSIKKSYEDMMMDEMWKEKWFERVCRRLGKERSEIDGKIFENFEELKIFMESLKLNIEDFKRILAWEIKVQNKKENKKRFWTKEKLGKIAPLGRDWKYAHTVNLDQFSTDLSGWDPTEYRDVEVIGHENEIEIMKLILKRPQQNNIMLIGNPGIGRKSLVHHLAKMIREQRIEKYLRNKRILQLDLGMAMSSVYKQGENVEHYLHRMFREAAYAGNIILYLENIENFLGKDKSMLHPDISPILEEYLGIPTFQIVATSTVKEYHNLIEHHENFVKYFEPLEMSEIGENYCILILLLKYEKMEEKFPIFTFQALKSIVKNSGRYFGNAPLPERAIDLAEEVLLFWEKSAYPIILPKTVDDFLSLKTEVSFGEVKKDEREKLLNLENILHQRIVGQEEAIDQVAQAVRKIRSGISNPKKPAGSFLFLGPTGVGKTETAKALAESYFGSEEKMIRLDMSEFQGGYAVSHLIGSENDDRSGYLTSRAKDNPFSLLLLDEIEKAYSQVLDLFLQILDEGYVTDATGEKINFRNMIIIATSNAGSILIKKMMEEGKNEEEIKEALIDYIIKNNIFRVEFLNHFDGIIFFRPLKRNELISVVKLALGNFSKKLKKEKNLEIYFSKGVVEKIIELGYNQTFGAQSVNRFIEDKVEDLIVRKIISGELKNGGRTEISEKDITFNSSRR